MARPFAIAGLFADNPSARAPMIAQMHRGLESLGWHAGAEYEFNGHFGLGDATRLDQLAKGIAAARPDAILVAGTLPALAAHAATHEIPIVMVGVGDPVARGLIASFERPGGNVTGSSDQSEDAARMRFAYFRRALGRPGRIGVLGSVKLLPLARWRADALAEGLETEFIDVPMPGGDLVACASAVAALDGMFVVPSPASFAVRHALAGALGDRRVPLMFGWREFMDARAPLGCGPNLTRLYGEAADCFRRLRVGETPATIPAVRPRFERWLRLPQAAAFGLALGDLEGEVDEVIRV